MLRTCVEPDLTCATEKFSHNIFDLVIDWRLQCIGFQDQIDISQNLYAHKKISPFVFSL